MTEFINNNSAACPDLRPNVPLATAGADNQDGFVLSYSFGASPAGNVGIRADGTCANPLPLRNGDFITVFGAGGYNGGSTNHGYTFGSGAFSLWADEDWSPSGTGTFASIDTRTRGVPGDILALRRIHITSDGITINDANGNEPTGGRLGAGTLNLASALAINGAPIASTGAGTTWTPTDQSGAGLVFANISTQFWRIGPLVCAYGQLQYPVTASPNAAKISLPVAVPNQAYAQVYCATNLDRVVLGSVPNTSTAQFVFNTAAQPNAALSGLFVLFMLIYPAS